LIGGSCLLATSFLIPAPRHPLQRHALPWWDIPVRMLASAVMVTVIALVSDLLGATASGIAASFPVLLTVIGTFTHHQWGSDALLALLRGITRSLLSFVMFFWVVATSVEPLGLVMSYVVATAAALGVSAALIVVNRRAAVAAVKATVMKTASPDGPRPDVR
jgi:Na+-transporting NADH:ubiquinone oxidoreductase subunit NqrE